MPSIYQAETLVVPITASEIMNIVFEETKFLREYSAIRLSDSRLCNTLGDVTVVYDRTIDGKRTFKSVTFFKKEVEQILQEYLELDSAYRLQFDDWGTKSWSLVKDITPREEPPKKRALWKRLFGAN